MNTIRNSLIKDKNEWLKDLTKRLKDKSITIDVDTMFGGGEKVLGLILTRHDKIDEDIYNNFLKTFKEHNRDAYKILKDSIDSQKLTDIHMIGKDGVEGFIKVMDKITDKRKSFKLFNPVLTTDGYLSNTLIKFFEMNRSVDTVQEILWTIASQYSDKIFDTKPMSEEQFKDLLNSQKNFNFMNAGFTNMLSAMEEAISINGGFRDRMDMLKIKRAKNLMDHFALMMQHNTEMPMLVHYITAPDYYRDAYQDTNYKLGIGLENYLSTFSDKEQIEMLNRKYHNMTPLEISATTHKSLVKTGKNDLTKTMSIMIKNGAEPTEKFWEILKEKGETKTIDALKQIKQEKFIVEEPKLKRSYSESDISSYAKKLEKERQNNKEKDLVNSIFYYVKEYVTFYPNLFVDIVKFILNTSKEVKHTVDDKIKSHTERANTNNNVVDFRR